MISNALLLAESPWTGNTVIVVLILVGVSVMAMVLTRRRIGRGTRAASGVRRAVGQTGTASSQTGRRQLQRSMEQLLLELEEVSREINSQVDTRLRALNLLIQEADQKITQLKRAQGLSDDDGPSTRHLAPPKQEPHPDLTRERYARVYALAEKGHSVVEIAREMDLMTGEVELILALRRTAPHPSEDRA